MENLFLGCVMVALLGIALGVARIAAYNRERNAALEELGWELDVTFGQLLAMRKSQP